MRLVIAAAPAFAAGVLVEGAARGAWWAWAGAALAGAAMVVRGVRRGGSAGRRVGVALLLVAVLAGAAASARTRARIAAGPAWPGWPPSAAPLLLEGRVVVAAEAAPGGGWRAVIDADTAGAADARTPVSARLLVRGDGAPPPAWPGDRVRLRATVRAPRAWLNPGAFDRARFLGGRGVDGLATAAPPGLVPVAAPVAAWHAPARVLARARTAWSARLAAAAPGDGGALLAALVVGARAGVRPSVEADFRDAGVTHVLSVSGLHLAAVAFLAFALLRRAWLRVPRWAERVPADRVAALVAAPLAIAYAQLTGAEVATQRALVATLVVLGATALGRRPDGATALGVACFVVLADAPWALYEASFQLSFTAAAALVFLAPRFGPPVQNGAPEASLGRRAFVGTWRLAAATLAATLATAPLTALHFGVVQPAGLVANLVVVPFAELIVLPLGLAGALLAAIWAPLGAPLLWLAGRLAGLLAALVHALAGVSPVLAVPAPGTLALVACGACLVALAAWRGRRGLIAAAVAVAIAAGVTWLDAVHAPRARRDLVVTFLDVGQGDAAVVELPGGETWLVDAGGRLFGAPGPGADADARLAALAGDPGEQAVGRFLAARHVRRLALVIVSHPHVDHYGGLAAVAARVPIDELWITGDEIEDPAWHALLASLAARGTRVVRPPLGVARAHRSGVRAVVLAPGDATEGAAVAPAYPGENDDSLVVAVEFAGRRVLFTGDLEAEGEQALVATHPPGTLVADVVKVPHHGSRTSSTDALVAATRPRAVIVSCGRDNRFGFPAASVVARWRAGGARVVRTDRAGAVTVRIDARGDLRLDTFVRDPREAP